MLKLVFMGTADFSATVLEKLNNNYKISAVVTGTDKVAGRGHGVIFSAVKKKAMELNLPLLQYDKVSKVGINDIKNLQPDLIVTAAFGQILSEEFLSIPKYGTLNVHASLLPCYRGSSPIQAAILNGDEVTGITIMRTVKAIDAGDILLSKELKIDKCDTAGSLFDKLSVLGGQLICEAVSMVENGTASYEKQDETKATFCKMIKKEDGLIDFNLPIKKIDCQVRAFTPWPSAYTHINGKILKIFEVEEAKIDNIAFENLKNGEVVVSNSKDGLIVKCNDGLIELKSIQAECCKRMSAKDFLKGHQIPKGIILEG